MHHFFVSGIHKVNRMPDSSWNCIEWKAIQILLPVTAIYSYLSWLFMNIIMIVIAIINMHHHHNRTSSMPQISPSPLPPQWHHDLWYFWMRSHIPKRAKTDPNILHLTSFILIHLKVMIWGKLVVFWPSHNSSFLIGFLGRGWLYIHIFCSSCRWCWRIYNGSFSKIKTFRFYRGQRIANLHSKLENRKQENPWIKGKNEKKLCWQEMKPRL